MIKQPATKFFRSKPMIEDPVDLPQEASFGWVRLLISVLVFLGISAGLYLALRNSWKEVVFAIKKPEIVREVRQLYVSEHDSVDKEILMRQRIELPTEAGQSAEIKKE